MYLFASHSSSSKRRKNAFLEAFCEDALACQHSHHHSIPSRSILSLDMKVKQIPHDFIKILILIFSAAATMCD